jgi:PleD family two-component response regulator
MVCSLHQRRFLRPDSLPLPRAKPVVLVVTNGLAIQARLEPVLRLHGFRPLRATKLANAMAMVEGTTVDAVVLDAVLGGGQHSLDLAKWLRWQDAHRDTPVVVIAKGGELSDVLHAAFADHNAVVFDLPEQMRDMMVFLRGAVASRD